MLTTTVKLLINSNNFRKKQLLTTKQKLINKQLTNISLLKKNQKSKIKNQKL